MLPLTMRLEVGGARVLDRDVIADDVDAAIGELAVGDRERRSFSAGAAAVGVPFVISDVELAGVRER